MFFPNVRRRVFISTFTMFSSVQIYLNINSGRDFFDSAFEFIIMASVAFVISLDKAKKKENE